VDFLLVAAEVKIKTAELVLVLEVTVAAVTVALDQVQEINQELQTQVEAQVADPLLLLVVQV
jgi:integral membrane sensor domain MASE1